MKSRGLVVAIAVVLAVLAAVGVIVYTSQVKNQVTNQETTLVLVATKDIPANTNLNPLIDEGSFEQIRVPNDAVVAGAVTDTKQLTDQVTILPILAKEQIPTSRLSGGEAQVAGGRLGLKPGDVGMSIELDTPQGVGGLLARGDNIVIYTTFRAGTILTKDDLKVLFSPAQLQRFLEAVLGQNANDPAALAQAAAQSPAIAMPFDFTVALIPSARIVDIQNPTVDTSTGRRSSGQVLTTLDLTPEAAQQLVFAESHAQDIWTALLPPESADGYNNQATIGVPFDLAIGERKKP